MSASIRRSSPDRKQLRHWAIRGSAGCGVAGAPQRRAFQQPVQHLALRVVEAVDQLGDLLGVLRGIFEGHLPGMPGQAAAGVRGHSQLEVTPDQRPCLEVVERIERRRLRVRVRRSA